MSDILTEFTLNGRAVRVALPVTASLLDALRGPLHQTAAKRGCDAGQCGSCNVFVDGVAVRACLTLACDVDGAHVTSAEGLAAPGALSVVQQAFVDSGAIQCGFCIPGMVVAATALLAEEPAPDRARIKAGLAGTLCRCSGYTKLFEAVELAAHRLREADR